MEGAYTQQGRAHIRRLHPDWAARPAPMSRAAHGASFFMLVVAVRLYGMHANIKI
jgi:hypothetical protein